VPDIFSVFGFKPIPGIAKHFEILIPPAEASRVFALFQAGKPYTVRHRSTRTNAEGVLKFKRVGDCVHVMDSSKFTPEEFPQVALDCLGLRLPPPPLASGTLKRVFRYLALCLEVPPIGWPEFDPIEYPELRSDLIGRGFAAPPIEQFTQCELFVSVYRAALFIELFATNQEEGERFFLTAKAFFQKPHIYTFALPVELPVLVHYVPERQ
jgi:hypothetical protein